jgi:hypothetical protein
VTRAAEAGLKLSAKDVSFVIEAVDEIDPWLEHTRSPSAVARAYRDYVFARCSQAGVQLNDDECQLVQVWFGASQWTGAAQAAAAAAGEQRNESTAAEIPPRRFATPEAALPAPSGQGAGAGLPLPDFGLPEHERESAQQQQPAKPSPLRYSFLKHG